MSFYSAIKNYEIITFESKLIELENIISKLTKIQKEKCHMFFLAYGS